MLNFARLKTCFLFLFLLVSNELLAQHKALYVNEIRFIEYLLNKDYNDEAVLATKLALEQAVPSNLKDSLLFLRGLAFYNLKQLDSSAINFLKVSASSGGWTKSRFFAAYNYIHLKNRYLADSILNFIPLSDSLLIELKVVQQSGISLLNRDLTKFSQLSKQYTGKYFAYANEEKKLMDLHRRIVEHKPKKPVLAASLSAILPGLGKIYAGRKGEGVSAMLLNLSLAAVAFDGQRRFGFKDARTIIASTGFLVFYTGNIIGSYHSAHLQNNLFYESIDQNILFNLHIPLRTVFN